MIESLAVGGPSQVETPAVIHPTDPVPPLPGSDSSLVNPKHIGIAAHGSEQLGIFATRHCELLERYERGHQLNALHTITKDSIDEFLAKEGVEFSRFKYGDPDSINYFAKQIAAQIWNDHRDEILANPDGICIFAPAYRKNPTAAVLLAWKVADILRDEYDLDAFTAGLSRRVLAAGDYGVLKTREAREALIFNNFYYDGPSLAGHTIFFVEDALVSGTHYQETQRVLVEEADVELKNIHGHFIVDVRPETFMEERFSVEDALNHLWIDRGRVERLAEILRKPEMRNTPRVLKMLLTEPWVQVEACLDQTETTTVLSILHAVRFEELDRKPDYTESFARLERYSANRLRCSKEAYDLHSSFTLDESTKDNVFSDGIFEHPRAVRKLTIAEGYSLLKFGDPEAIEFFAQRMAQDLQKIYGDKLRTEAGQWGIAAPGYEHGPGSAMLLGERVAEILGLPLIEVNRQDVPAASYGALGDAEARNRAVAESAYKVSGPKLPNVLLIEDSVVSGANTRRLMQVLAEQGINSVPFCLIDVASPRLELEERLNSAIVSENAPEDLIAILNDTRSCVTMRTLKTLLASPASFIEQIAQEVDSSRLVELFNLARDNQLHTKGAFRAGFATFRAALNVRIRHGKEGDLPAYEALYILDDGNSQSLMEKLGSRYSALKYGDPNEVERFADELATAIRSRFGDKLSENPGQWVVAANHHFRVPNAASWLGAKVAEKLGLQLADMRRHNVFEGEFGALSTRSSRQAITTGNAFASNPHIVLGKSVLYIDDAIVSGSHLEEHYRALLEAGAAEIESFALIDVAGSDLTLERALNYARIKSKTAEQVLSILSNPDAPLLTRSMKLLLKLDAAKFADTLPKLSDERVFEFVECAAIEGYDCLVSMKDNFLALKNEALRRHLNAKTSGPSALQRDFRVMLFDYDGTLADTLTPLSEEMMEQLTFFLKRGVHIGIQTLQPIGERGIEEFTLSPLRAYLERKGESLSTLTRLHLIPSEGVVAYRMNEYGVRIKSPEYDLGFADEEWQALQNIVFSGKAGELAIKNFTRGAYISLHFASKEDLQTARAALMRDLLGFSSPIEVAEKKAASAGKHVLHIKGAYASKEIGRDYMLRTVAAEILKESWRKLCRDEILVVGDRMGESEGENDDLKMFVHGGVNFAVGKEVAPGCCGEFLKLGPGGTLAILQAIRARV